MFQVVCVGIFDTAIVNNKHKGDISYVVAKEFMGILALCLAMFYEEGP